MSIPRTLAWLSVCSLIVTSCTPPLPPSRDAAPTQPAAAPEPMEERTTQAPEARPSMPEAIPVQPVYDEPRVTEAPSGPLRIGRAQPASIPGDWIWEPQLLPPMDEIVQRPPPDRPVYGLYCWANEYLRFREFIQDTGWKNFRLSGPINDAVMKAYIEDDAEVMFTMPARKPFAEPGEVHGKWRNRGNFDSDEAFIRDYIGDVEAVIRRYGPHGTFFRENMSLPHRPLTHIEIFNEPNFWYLDTAREDKKNHWPPKDREQRLAQEKSRQELYGKLLKAASTRIKQLNPTITVVGFGAGGTSGADVPFIEGVHEAYPDIARYYDVLSTHPYVRPAPPEAALVKSWANISIAGGHFGLERIKRDAGATAKPTWWTELNWTIFPEIGGRFDVPTDPSGMKVLRDVSPELQAAYIVRGYAWALRLGIQRVFYMSIVDTDGVNSGMFDAATGTPRLSGRAVKHMIATMPRPKLLGAMEENTDGTYIYRFDPDYTAPEDGTVIMAMRVQGPKTVSIPVDADSVRVTDMTGDDIRDIPVTEGRLTMEIGPLPVYIITP